MHIEAEAIVCAVRHHGEHGAIVRAMTAEHGLLAGYVRGGRSRTMRPILQPSNVIIADFRARTEDQLAGLTVELVHSRGPLMAEPLAAAALDWTTALSASALPEGQPYPRVYAALGGVLDAIEASPAARGWAVALVRYELLILAELGFGTADIPAFLRNSDAVQWAEIFEGLRRTGTELEEYVYADRRIDILASRERLVERLKRAVA